MTAGQAVAADELRARAAPGTEVVELDRLARMQRLAPGLDPVGEQAVIWLLRAAGNVEQAFQTALRDVSLSMSAYNALRALANTEGHVLSPQELAGRLLVSRPSVSGLLDTLEGRGLVERHEHPGDRRRLQIRLTDRGMDLVGDFTPVHLSITAACLAGLSGSEKAQLVGLLRRVTRGQDEQDEQDEQRV